MDGADNTKANLAEGIEDLRHVGEDFRADDKQIQLLSAITEQVTDAVVTTDLDYKITYVNLSFQKIYGYSRDELLGQQPNILNAPGSSEEIGNDIYETISSGSIWRGEIGNRRKDGSTFPCEITVIPLKDEKDNVFAYAGTHRDITERKKVEEELRQDRQKYELAQKAAHFGMWEWDIASGKTRWLGQFETLFGFDQGKLEQNFDAFIHLVHPQDRKKVVDGAEACVKKQGPCNVEYRITRPDGEVRWMLGSGDIMRASKGQPESMLGFVQDITERKKAEEELRLHSEVMKNMAEGVYLVGTEDNIIIWTNPEFEKMFGYDAGEMNGQHVSIVNAPTDKDPAETAREIIEVLNKTGQWHGEVNNIKKNGTSFWCHANCSVFNHPEYGRVVISVHTDITEHKLAEKTLRESEEGYRILAEQNPHGIQEIDACGTITFANQAHHEMYGYEPDELTGRSITDFLALDSRRRELADYLKMLVKDQPTPTPYHQKILTAHGQERDVEVVWNYLRDAKGCVAGFISVLTDITERMQAEEKLKQEAVMRVRLLDNLPCIAMILKKETREIVASNEAARQVGAIPGKTCYGTCVRWDDLCPFCHAPELWDTNKPKRLEVEYRGVYYEGIWVSLTEELYIHYIFDITEHKKAEKQLEIAKHKAEAANIAKSQFLANMSHEIRTPMSVITGFADLLTMEELTDEQKVQAILIQKAGKSLLRILDDVLDFSRIEAGKLEVRTRDYTLKKLLDRVESMMQPLAARKDLDFKLSCSKRLPAMIHTDDDRLVQCLVNLIGNAIKFTYKGSIHLKVSLEKRRNRYFVRFDVKDTGMGIPPDKYESIFSSFTQVDGSHTRKQGGTGLGLTITKELAKLLGGDLSFTSEVGAGSVFSLVIPADAELSILSGGDQPKESVLQSQPVDNLTFGGRVLVAEDEEGSKILAENLLTRLGLEVVIAANGKEAIEKALHEPWDLIFMDIQMPILNGYEAVRKLRRKGIKTPIVALTAHAMPGDREKCLSAGCNGYISKPFEMKELQKALSSHISIADSQT